MIETLPIHLLNKVEKKMILKSLILQRFCSGDSIIKYIMHQMIGNHSLVTPWPFHVKKTHYCFGFCVIKVDLLWCISIILYCIILWDKILISLSNMTELFQYIRKELDQLLSIKEVWRQKFSLPQIATIIFYFRTFVLELTTRKLKICYVISCFSNML